MGSPSADQERAEKEQLKTSLLSRLEEPDSRISKQLGITISEIARHEWPRNWPSLFPSLVSAAQMGVTLQSNRALFTLYEVDFFISAKFR